MSWTPAPVLDAVALAVSAAGLLLAAAVVVVAGVRAGVPVLLDFLLAASLLKLAADRTPTELAVTAIVVAVRHLASTGLAAGPPASDRRASVDRA